MNPSRTNPLMIALFLLGLACWGLGSLFDYTEWKYGKPPRLALRWNFLGVLAAIPIMTAAIVLALIEHHGR